VDKRFLPLGIPPGEKVSGPVTIRNINPEPTDFTVAVTNSQEKGGNKQIIHLEPGESTDIILTYGVPKESKKDERIDFSLDITWGNFHTDWLIPVRVISELDARLVCTGKKSIALRLTNRVNRFLSGNFEVKASNELKIFPSEGHFSVKPGESVSYPLTVDLPSVEIPTPIWSMVRYDGGETEAHFQAFPTVFNGSFELCNFGKKGEGIPDGWWVNEILRKTQDYSKVPSTTTEKPYEGKRCLMLSPSDCLGTWNVFLRPNTRYRLSCAIKRTAGNSGGIALSAVGDIWSIFCGNTKSPKLNEWELFETEFTTGSEDTRFYYLQIQSAKEGITYFDAIKITEVDKNE